MTWLVLLALGVVAGTVGGVVGFGGSTILLPALVLVFGPKEAVPIMGLAGLLANLARVTTWWHAIDWRAAAVYSLTGVPSVALGARLFLALDARMIEGLLGVFMIAMVPVRRWLMARQFTIGLGGLALAGIVVGFLTGMVASTGPISTPFFLAFGLVKGAYVATEALGSLSVFSTKSLVFQRFGAIGAETAIKGAIIGAAMMVGSGFAKRIVERLEARQFGAIMDAVMLLAGVSMLAAVWA